MKIKSHYLLCALVIMSCSHKVMESGAKHILLFNNKDLSNWDVYIGPGLDAEGKHRADVPALGLNPKQNVFTVVAVDDQPNKKAIHITGERFGGISTKEEYENYHFQCKFKWGKLKWPPKDKARMDSGILYHAVGPHAVDWGFWMRSQELQIQEKDCGDYWGLDRASFDIRAIKNDKGDYVYNPKGEILTFNVDNPTGRHCIKSIDAEWPTGEWNTIDLYCLGGTAIHMVNGKVNMILLNSRHIQDGVATSLTKGKIQIQSEGAEIYYTDMVIEKINKLPDGIMEK